MFGEQKISYSGVQPSGNLTIGNYLGAIKNFSEFSDFSKYVLMFDMLAGRLEIFPMILLFHPATWKK